MKTNRTATARQAAIQIGCGMKRVYDLLYARKLEATKIENRWVIPMAAIEKHLQKRGR